jgi:hypothetical protein
MAKETLQDGKNLVAGWITTRQIPLVADTYYVGMLLEYAAGSDAYQALAAGSLAAIYNGIDGRVLAAPGVSDCIMGGEIYEAGLVDASGDALTVTEDARALYRAEGFYLKEA